MTVSAAAMAGALAIALMGSEARRVSAPQVSDAARAVGFAVRFQGQGPISRAARARDADAIAAQLQTQNDFDGLCLDRFAGPAAVILRSCEAIAANQRASVAQAWLQRLRSMRGVAYAQIDTAPITRTPD